jgi:hypothetical protein
MYFIDAFFKIHNSASHNLRLHCHAFNNLFNITNCCLLFKVNKNVAGG